MRLFVAARRAAFSALLLAGGACASAAPASTAAAVPPPAANGELLAPERIAALPAAQRAAWEQYMDRSERQRQIDRRSIEAELQALGRERWVPAPDVRGKILQEPKPAEWFGSDEARRIAEAVLSYQTPAGAWSKNVDYRRGPRQPGQSYYSTQSWSYIGTFDNDATTDEMVFLARVHEAQGGDGFRDAILRGLEYVFQSQFPNGCWPQVYPLQGGYHDAATYNDEAMPNILHLLRDVGRGRFLYVPAATRQRADAAVRQGVECVLASQVVVDGRLTVWGQQHDPLTLAPVAARAYEHASLTAGESVDVVEFLMQLESPDARVIRAVHAAAEWFRENAIHGFDYRHPELVEQPGGVVWARFYELGSNRPIFSNRDGQILYNWHELDEERRRGYAWYRTNPAGLLRRYAVWAARYPLPA
jgi:PelA/Pel-15E family pectate lyase